MADLLTSITYIDEILYKHADYYICISEVELPDYVYPIIEKFGRCSSIIFMSDLNFYRIYFNEKPAYIYCCMDFLLVENPGVDMRIISGTNDDFDNIVTMMRLKYEN